MDYPKKLAKQGTRAKKNKNTTHMCWTPLYANKHNNIDKT